MSAGGRSTRKACTRGLRGLLAAAALPLTPPASAAGDAVEPIAGLRQLQELAGSLTPLPDTGSGITRDVGQVAVIEHDGSRYDRDDPDGAPNYAARAPVALRFYQTHGDAYDFLVVFTNFEFQTGGAQAFHSLIRNDVTGIGLPVVDSGALFGSPGRLKGYVDMADVSRWRGPGSAYGLHPGDPGFVATLNALAHEVGHQWLAQVRYRDASGQASSDLLGLDGIHWSYLLDSDASVMHGSDWTPAGEGSYVAARTLSTYSSLDLYLMGFLAPEGVAPFTLLRNPAVDPRQGPVEGATLTASPETVSLPQIAAVEGPRHPDHWLSPKAFRLGFVFLTRPGTEPDPEDLAAVEAVRQFFAAHFFALTRGVAVADTTLAETPAGAPAPAPDLDRALAWLLAAQSPDGRWEDTAPTALRDSAAVLEALAHAGVTSATQQRGLLWLTGSQPRTLDFAARRAALLGRTGVSAPDRAALIRDLLAAQDQDGGFGFAPGYASDALDTALALRALSALGQPLGSPVRAAIASLGALQLPAGGWPAVAGAEVSTVVTAEVLLALQDWSAAAETQPLVASGLAALLARRNPDQGFGESPSTPYATALGLQVLLRAGAPAAVVDGAVAWLQAAQLADGSWSGSRYETALVLGALKAGVAPNLTTPPDGLVLEPPAVREGATVRVTARIRNVGRTPAAASRARLFDGDPSLGPAVAEQPVPALEPGADAAVTFDFPTTDRAGTHTLYVVADAGGEIAEAREDDNSASRALTIDGLLPDLVLGPGDVEVTPYPPQEGETVQVAVTVTNDGEKASGPSLVRLVRGNPRQGGAPLGEGPLPALAAGQSATVTLPWNTVGQIGDHVLFAVADAAYAVTESSEANNEASLPVRVTAPLPPGADLEVALATVSPAALTTIPQSVEVRALVRNLGADPAVSTVALLLGTTSLSERPIDLGPRASTTVTFPVDVVTPGSRTYVVRADPAGTLAETDETNNERSATLNDAQDTVDLAVRDEDVTPSAADLVVGEPLVVTATVRNFGTAPVAEIPVILGQPSDSGLIELARTTVSAGPGAAVAATLTWTTSFTGDAMPLVVRVDPFQLLAELSETNNDAGLTVRVRPSALPNLRVGGADVRFEPDPPREGEDAVVTVVVRNPSPAPAGPFAVRFYRGDPDQGGTLIGETSVPGVDAVSEVIASTAWSPVDARGAQGVFVLADPAGQVEEYDESDNRAFRPFQITGLPDIVLASADVSLEPGFPRAGEAVGIRAVVRNLGEQEAGASVLRALEGEPGQVVAEAAVPALPPGEAATLDLAWTPAAPPGERLLSLRADADDAVVEQDEGNNLARRSVLVQDADLYLSAPYFSPDGDGVQDETVLSYRASSEVRVVVSDARGRRVRTLAEQALASSAIAWDGRDDSGRLLWDGDYIITVEGQGGAALGRIRAVLDTNRLSLHEAAGTGQVALRNLTCQLPNIHGDGPVFLPAEDELLFILTFPSGGFEPGILRMALDGVIEYAGGGPDPWYATPLGNTSRPRFASARAVSPDGREVLVTGVDHVLWAVDLETGARRQVASASETASWSPDGRWIATDDQAIARDGSQVHPLGRGPWTWSPDGELLAAGGHYDLEIVRRDGTEVREVEFPDGFYALQTTWLGDGRVFVWLTTGVIPEEDFQRGLLVDPLTGETQELPWLDKTRADIFGRIAWSADGSRLLYRRGAAAWVAQEDGSELQLFAGPPDFDGLAGSPRGTAASYWTVFIPQPGDPCQGTQDLVVATSLQNLTAEFQASRLVGNNGVLLRGTISDAHLEHFQLEYAGSETPDEWHPIGAASDVPVVDDMLTAWVPPGPGTYLVRLRASDRAGNARARTRLVAWDRTPIIANVTQTESLVSPNGDGRKDSVLFRYLVLEPTRVEVRMAGPEPSADGAPAPTVRRFSLEHPGLGPASFEWDGRDDAGRVVVDGRYTVYLNDLPYRVEIDATPPDIAFRYDDVGSGVTRAEACGHQGVEIGTLTATRAWHVVDAHLKQHSLGTTPVYEPERDSEGAVIHDQGVPRVRRLEGRAADRRDPIAEGPDGLLGLAVFEAEDHAGNRSAVSVPPAPERLWLLEGRPEGCAAFGPPPLDRMLPPIQSGTPYLLRPRTEFHLASTAQPDPPAASDLLFRYQSQAGGSWIERPLASPGMGTMLRGGRGPVWNADLIGAGVPAGGAFRGQFAGPDGMFSETFLFRVCDDFLSLEVAEEDLPGSPDLVRYTITVMAETREPLASVSVTVRGRGELAGFQQDAVLARVEGDAAGRQVFQGTIVAPRTRCGCPVSAQLSFSATATGLSGRAYRHDGVCATLRADLPAGCPTLEGTAEPRYCQAPSADALSLRLLGGLAQGGGRIRIERGPEGDPIVMDEFGASELLSGPPRTLDLAGLPEGPLTLRARLFDPEHPDDPARQCDLPIETLVDRTPPVAGVVSPADGSALCVEVDPVDGREKARIVVRVQDAAPEARLSEASFRLEGGDWQSLSLTRDCLGDAACPQRPDGIPTNADVAFRWDVSGLAAGDYTLRLTFCDPSGNTTTIEHHVALSRDRPDFALASPAPEAFSPNGDGRADTIAARVVIAAPLLMTAEVHRLDGGLVRRLFADRTMLPGAHDVIWDGRDEAGQVVADGRYAISLSGANPCGNDTRTRTATATVDTTPPQAVLTAPETGALLAVGTDVEGVAADPNFAVYTLAFGPGALPPAPTVFASSAWPVGGPGTPGLLGRWHPPAVEGPYTLRLEVRDQAQNTAVAQVLVTLGPRNLLERFAATPDVFSPNGDGRREAATLEYELRASGIVRLEVRDGQGVLRRVLLSGIAQDPGVHALAWDGREDGAAPAPDGAYRARIRVEDPATGSFQEGTLALGLDRAPPAIVVDRPAADAYVSPGDSVRGSVTDDRLASYAVTTAAPGGASLELARGVQPVAGGDLAFLGALSPDGAYLLTVRAEDQAENRSAVDVPFVLDSSAPIVRLVSPVREAVLRRGEAPLPVVGTVVDANLEQWTLDFGPGRAPAYFAPLAQGAAAGQGFTVGSWPLAGLADGEYTLRLRASDLAGQASEAAAAVTLDGTPPTAVIDLPAAGSFVNTPPEVRGAASDANLRAWRLDAAPGTTAGAFEWSPVAAGESAVAQGTLGTWAPLPSDGPHTLRLTVEDATGLASSVRRTVIVDTTPPLPPAGLAADVLRDGGGTADVRLRWNTSPEPDLAGYRVRRDQGDWTAGLLATPTHLDPDRTDGSYRYEVVAVDQAGNQSLPASVVARVDLTPPVADILRPEAGASLSGTVAVRGTALSADDFKEYRLLVGAGDDPASWTLLRRSTIPVAAGILGDWTAFVDGPHTLALEAEDTSGNQSRATVTVRVDLFPPSAPVLTAVDNVPAPDALTARWQPSPEDDVAGYLVHRNDRIANAPGIVLGDLHPFLVPPPSYADPALPDGRHCYRVAAMDEAGNLSPSSNEICQTLDNRPPSAVVLQPSAGARFDYPVRVLAHTPDTDVSVVQFEYKPSAEPDWRPLGVGDAAPPFETTFDPAGLAFGAYRLRAVATDQAGHTDPAPIAIDVVYGDVTPPDLPRDLTALVDADDVRLEWTPNGEADLAGYHVYRGGERLTAEPQAEATFFDRDRPVGHYEYRVTAVDDEGNESTPATAGALVYALALHPPSYPVTEQDTAVIRGGGARQGTTLTLFRNGAPVSQAPVERDGDFAVPGVALPLGGNVFRAEAVDTHGNRAIPSDEVVVIANRPPPDVTGLVASVTGTSVSLAWDPVTDPELAGYVVHRGEQLLTAPRPWTTAASIAATSSTSFSPPANAFDGNPATAWLPVSLPASWTVTFAQPMLLDRITLGFDAGFGPFPAAAYRVEARWQGRFVPLVSVTGNTQATVEHALPAPFSTDAVRVVVPAQPDPEVFSLGLSEAQVTALDVVAAGAATFTEDDVLDGRHEYRVAAIDVHGATGGAGSAPAEVGDVVPPAPPAGLAATVENSDVLLGWDESPEPDLHHYVVLRDAVRMASTAEATYRDASRPNGEYRYTVIAADAVGNESAESAPAFAVVAVATLPAPVLAAATPPEGDVLLTWEHPGASEYALFRATTAGGPYEPLVRIPGREHRDTTAANGVEHSYVVRALDALGNASAASNEVRATPRRTIPPAVPEILFPTDAAHPIVVDSVRTDVQGRAGRDSLVALTANGVLVGLTPAEPTFAEARTVALPQGASVASVSGDAAAVAYTRTVEGGTELHVLDLETGVTEQIAEPGYPSLSGAVLSGDGRRVAYQATSPGAAGFFVADRTTGEHRRLEPALASEAAWAPDGQRLAYVLPAGFRNDVFVFDLASGTRTRISDGYFSAGQPAWSPDGTRLAFVRNSQVRVVDSGSGVLHATWTGVAPVWSPDGQRIACEDPFDLRRVQIRDLATGGVMAVAEDAGRLFAPRFDPTGRWLSLLHTTEDAAGQVRTTVLVHDLSSGEKRTLLSRPRRPTTPVAGAHLWTPVGMLALGFDDRLGFFQAEDGYFEMRDVALAPGENFLVAEGLDTLSGLSSGPSAPVSVTVAAGAFPDLAVAAASLASYPAVASPGQPAVLSARVDNLGAASANDVGVVLTLVSPDGALAVRQEAIVSAIAGGGAAVVSAAWTPAVPGRYRLEAEVDPESLIAEARDDNNSASAFLTVAESGLLLGATADRTAYSARATAVVEVAITNGGPPLQATLRTVVEDASGHEVALVDERPISLDYAGGERLDLTWSVGSTYAGAYAFVTRLVDEGGGVTAEARDGFQVLPDLAVAGRVVPEQAFVAEGAPAAFACRVENLGANVPLSGLVARLRVVPEGAEATIVFQADVSLPLLLPGGLWEDRLVWPTALPAGRYAALFTALQGEASLATAQASFEVRAAGLALSGAVAVEPADVLLGGEVDARLTVTNLGVAPVVGLPVTVDVADATSGTVLLQQPLSLDLAAGETRAASVRVATASLGAGRRLVFLHAGSPPVSLARTPLRVHAPIVAPSVHAPADGSRVAAAHPALIVNNAQGTDGETLSYEFRLYADAALTIALPGVTGVVEGDGRTAWRVATRLGEDRTFFWQARATDGFSSSAWTPVASFTVDEANEPPSAPVPDRPLAGERVATREPTLVVANAIDPELDALTYEFRIAADPELANVLTSASGVPQGPAFTGWRTPTTLAENTTFWWSARATDGVSFSPWSGAVSFHVDSLDEPPSAPRPLRPVGGETVRLLTPALVVANAADPEGRPLTYRFEVDRLPSFDSPALQTSTDIPEGTADTAWTPAPLFDNALYFWRAAASDGATLGPWATESFLVNLANDPPGAPAPLDPADLQVVTTATPTLRVRNAVDVDGDALTYEFTVTDEQQTVVASATGVPEGPVETTWPVPVPLAEGGLFTWTARARDAEAAGPSSAAFRFRVNAVHEPPTAPGLVAPPEGAALETRTATLVVSNATSPEGLPLTYAFELFSVGEGDVLTLVDMATGVPEGVGTTSWTPAASLADGPYAWRARAEDSVTAGPWMATARFRVAVDAPPLPPTGLEAVPGDMQVALTWSPSSEPDVAVYNVYRGTVAGGPYAPVASTTSPAFLDQGLANGITVYYVVTAADARAESAYSAEVAATPQAGEVVAEVRYRPDTIAGACLLASRCGRHGHHGAHSHGGDDGDCPAWVYAAVELPGLDPASIDRQSVRLAGAVRPDRRYGRIVDSDGDGHPEQELRFRFEDVAPHLSPGVNALSLTGRAAHMAFRGVGEVTVSALEVDLWFTPRTLQKKSHGQSVQARLTFAGGVDASDVDTASLRLNEAIPIQRVVSSHGDRLTVKFDRGAVIALLPVGGAVEVRVSGTVRGVPFVARDVIRVIE